MALACQEAPDHSTFAEFIGRVEDRITLLFSEVLLVCYEEGLLGGTHFALDGLKLPSNASRECSGTLQDLRLKERKLKERIKEKLREHRRADQADHSTNHPAEQHRRQASLERLRRQAERIGAFLEEAEPRQGARGEIQSNVTDNDSARMHTGHGTIQGYNAQALVDHQHQIIVQAAASSDGQDYRQVEPMFQGATETLELAGLSKDISLQGAIFSADTSYHSEENLKACEAYQVNAFIPDTGFRRRDVRFATQPRHKPSPPPAAQHGFGLERFRYDVVADCYHCPRGKVLRLEAATAKTARGNEYRRYRARREDCLACPLRRQCLSRPEARCRSLHVPKTDVVKVPTTLSQKMRIKIDQPESRALYAQRLATVEPVFANLRHNKGLNRFTYRGRKKVNTQWQLFCLVHNVEKLAHRSGASGSATHRQNHVRP
jgi:hypothetical protein